MVSGGIRGNCSRHLRTHLLRQEKFVARKCQTDITSHSWWSGRNRHGLAPHSVVRGPLEFCIADHKSPVESPSCFHLGGASSTCLGLGTIILAYDYPCYP